MKKKLLIGIGLGLLALYSCKKDNQQNDNTQTTNALSGKWKRVILQDTIYDGKSIFGINTFPVDNNQAELNFNTTTSGTSTVPTYKTFTYSIQDYSLTYSTGIKWKIIKISDTRIKLTMHEDAAQEGGMIRMIKNSFALPIDSNVRMPTIAIGFKS